jgi:hypothetical protein
MRERVVCSHGGFRYAIYFVYEGEVIEVFAVLHQHRVPFFWRSRAR